jgi:hypothetical protein
MTHSRLMQLATNDEGFCFDPRTGETYQLNDTARLVLTELKKGQSEDAAARTLAATYEIPLYEAETDTQEFMQMLRINGVT